MSYIVNNQPINVCKIYVNSTNLTPKVFQKKLNEQEKINLKEVSRNYYYDTYGEASNIIAIASDKHDSMHMFRKSVQKDVHRRKVVTSTEFYIDKSILQFGKYYAMMPQNIILKKLLVEYKNEIMGTNLVVEAIMDKEGNPQIHDFYFVCDLDTCDEQIDKYLENINSFLFSLDDF